MGNFLQIGPYDGDLNPRDTSWVRYCSVLFVDSPAGSGFSYADSEQLFTSDVSGVVTDLIEYLRQFFSVKHREFKGIPFYIVGSSYSGKVAPRLALRLRKEIENGRIDSNLKGVAIGGPWIAPIISVKSYGNFWHSMSMIDSTGKTKVDELAGRFADLLESSQGGNQRAYNLFCDILSMGPYKGRADVNVYNVRESNNASYISDPADADRRWWTYTINESPALKKALGELKRSRPDLKHFRYIEEIKPYSIDVHRKLRDDCFTEYESFKIISEILHTTNLTVVVYNGQLDGIVTPIGTEAVLNNLKWYGAREFINAHTNYFKTPGDKDNSGFVKRYAGLSYYVVYGAGHYVFAEKGMAGLKILKDMVNEK
ncbi:retinoid-inducible serine carboxypeptidase-like [Tubulanus polymorphus]|uniref:retinoid-inducible serine carboxypeptidase-like n=1 Tax=Tubulanus polymorphus TaxID=672921 RepID=UPI003DA40FE5